MDAKFIIAAFSMALFSAMFAIDSAISALTKQNGPSGVVSLVTVDDVHYAMPVALGTPAQSLYLTADFEQYLSLLVPGVPVPGDAKRSFFNRSLSSTFIQTGLSKGAVSGNDTMKLTGGGAYNATTSLKVFTDVDQARQLYDGQPFDGLIGPGVMYLISGASLYTFDARRACTSGPPEAAGTLVYGAYDSAGCEAFSPVPVTARIDSGQCDGVTYLTVTDVTAGPASARSTPIRLAITLKREDITLPPTLFEPIKAAYNATLRRSDSRYVVKCDVKYPPLTLTINESYQLTIDSWNMVYRRNGVCYLRATWILPDVQDDCERFYIGIPLFHQYCLAFNLISGTNAAPLSVARKRNVNSSMCTYVPVTTAAFPTTTISPGQRAGLSAGSIAAVVVACLVTLSLIIAVVFFRCRHRATVSRFGFLLAFSESRRRSKTERVFPLSEFRTELSNDDKQAFVDEWLISGDELAFDSSEVLGTGHFSTVFKGALKNRGGYGAKQACSSLAVAVKVPNEGPNIVSDDIWREIQRHKELKAHVHVLQMLGYKAANALRPIIVFEYCSEGDLLKWLQRQRSRTEYYLQRDGIKFDYAMYLRQQLSITWQVSNGMTFVSSRGIIHRDLAARNILLAEGLVAKIGDFGLARNASDNFYPNKTFGRLPVKRMAPEPLKSGTFTAKSDVWSFGLLIYEIFSSGEEPFFDVEPERMLAAIEDGVRPSKPERCPEEVLSIAQDCCTLDPKRRPTFHKVRDVLAHCLDKTVAHDGYLSFSMQAEAITGFNDVTVALDVGPSDINFCAS